MKKGIALIIALLLALTMLSGCNLIGYDAKLDGDQVVAKVNDRVITKAEWINYRDYLIAYEQQYYQQYFGFSVPTDDATIAAYGEDALEQMIEAYVVEDKMAEMGFDTLSDEELAEAQEYATGMADFYKMMVRYENYPGLETVEEEAARLAAATPGEATPAEPVATVTDEELNKMLDADMAAIGYTYDFFYDSEVNSVKQDKFTEHVVADVTVSDEEVQAEFDRLVQSQQTSYDATPSAYYTAKNNGTAVYYVPAGYRGVKNLLVKIDDTKLNEINTLKSTITSADSTIANATYYLNELNAEDTSEYDEAALAAHNEQKAAYEGMIADATASKEDAQAKLDALTAEAFAEIKPVAEEALAKAAAGEDFDALIAAYGEDPGMTTEPNKTTGYLVCEGMTAYEPAFQAAAMELGAVGDVSAELVQTSYGYHILQYAGDIPAGPVEMTEEIRTTLHSQLLNTAKSAAYEAAVDQWIIDAKASKAVETFPKVMND